MSDRDDTDISGQGASADAVYAAVAAALADHDKATAVRTAVEAVTAGAVSIPGLYRDVLARILADTGAAWQTGKTAIWEEHLASSTVRTIVEILYPGVLKAKAAVAPAGRSVLLACPPEEGHDLGLRMVSDRFDMAGWTTFFLGPDTPVAEIADAARRLGVDAVVMSSSTHFHRVAVRHAVDALKKELPGTGHLGRRAGVRRRRDRLAAAGGRRSGRAARRTCSGECASRTDDATEAADDTASASGEDG